MKRIALIVSVLFTSMWVSAQQVKKMKIADLQKVIEEARTPMVINFWATFCVPCIQEIPWFQDAVKAHKTDSVQLLLVSLDLREDYAKIAPMAVKRNFTAPLAWLDETNADYFCPKIDSAWSGAIPASIFINNRTGYRKFFEDQLPKEKVEQEIKALTGRL